MDGENIYGYPNSNKKYLTYNITNNLVKHYDIPKWLIFGDMNLVTNKKNGGNSIDINLTNLINSMFYDCGVHDIRFDGKMDTWCNNNHDSTYMVAKLDKFMVTQNWIDQYLIHTNIHLPRIGSDYNHIVLSFNRAKVLTKSKRQAKMCKRFENIWLEDPNTEVIIYNN